MDFRPERSPLKNLSHALADAFSIQQSSIETEMRRGFSSLIDLYVNSAFHVNEHDESWQLLPEGDKKLKNRNASNLLLLVDQFEEFFTNPENYYNETPSEDSQIVVNLVLETARIAQQQNLPIYVVCTMRSDYIGQCSSFRGLAENIGYSQFFVPRLKRKELKQVIEDPAVLSGNRITQRLTERLVYDLSEGVDQLPILQHALSQIWLEANRGTEEMDLIHYAMVGGMPSSQLPPEDQIRFDAWFASLPDYQKKFYDETGLNKVIENHASRLYEGAAEVYNAQNPSAPVAPRDAKNIIALAFSCLTRIDNSRAVRNRMTLGEISAIINRPDLPAELIGNVLDIFRQEGNSFIRPFKDAKAAVSDDTVLDITHESLIRNWGKLRKWATNEYAYYSTFLDLRKQLERWKQSGKRSGYLLPIGPLTYFENWYATCNPNTGWINRYAERSADPATNWKESERLLNDLREYLKRSANHVRVSRAFVKYGAGNIVIGISLLAALLLCGWYWRAGNRMKNENVMTGIRKAAMPILASQEVNGPVKSHYLLVEERLDQGSASQFLEAIADRNDRIALAVPLYKELLLIDKKYDKPLKTKVIALLSADLDPRNANGDLAFYLEQRNIFIYQLAFDNYYNARQDLEKTLSEESARLYPLIMHFFTDTTRSGGSITTELNQAIQHWLSFGKASEHDIRALLDLISPAANERARSVFQTFYPEGSYEPDGLRPINFRGGYHTLASLYAAIGDTEKIKWCFEQLSDQPDYFSGKLLNDYSNIIGYLYHFGHSDNGAAIAGQVQRYFPTNTPAIVYTDLITRSGYITHLYRLNFYSNTNRLRSEDGNISMSLCLSSREQVRTIAADYEKILSGIPDAQERNYLLAMHFKRLAMFESKYHYDRGLALPAGYIDGLLDKAWRHFTQVSDAYLGRTVTLEYIIMARIHMKNITLRENFIYPDYMGGWLALYYHSDVFFRYMEKNGLLSRAYRTPQDLEQLHLWIASMEEVLPFQEPQAMTNHYPIEDGVIFSAIDFVTHHPSGQNFDSNLLYLMAANRSFAHGDTTAGLEYFNKLNFNTLHQSAERYEFSQKSRFRNYMLDVARHLALINRTAEAVRTIERFESVYMQQICYAEVASSLYDDNFNSDAFMFLDSALSKWTRLANPSVPDHLEFRSRFIRVFEKIGGDRMIELADRMMQETAEGRKVQSSLGRIVGSCERSDFFHANASILPSYTESQDLVCKTMIMRAGAQAKEKRENLPQWKAFDDFFSVDYVHFLGQLF